MKKVLFTIFAHPDDESFGPSGTLLKEIREHATDVHLITLTSGQNGTNPDNHDDLGAVRLKEWHAAGTLIGASSMHHLGYTDGELSNSQYHDITKQLFTIVDEALSAYTEPYEVEFMTFDLNGVSGHIDHIVAARTACFVFYSKKKHDSRFARIRFACIPKHLVSKHDLSWIYMECGRSDTEINEVVDATRYRDDIISIMRAHHSQRHDCESNLAMRGEHLGIDYFIVKE